jgi:hypothetical protein
MVADTLFNTGPPYLGGRDLHQLLQMGIKPDHNGLAEQSPDGSKVPAMRFPGLRGPGIHIDHQHLIFRTAGKFVGYPGRHQAGSPGIQAAFPTGNVHLRPPVQADHCLMVVMGVLVGEFRQCLEAR